jgi:hypothetical protein
MGVDAAARCIATGTPPAHAQQADAGEAPAAAAGVPRDGDEEGADLMLLAEGWQLPWHTCWRRKVYKEAVGRGERQDSEARARQIRRARERLRVVVHAQAALTAR